MIILYALGILLALLIIVLCTPLGFRVYYSDEMELTLLLLLCIPIKLYPQKQKKPKEHPERQGVFFNALRKAAGKVKCFFVRCLDKLKNKASGGKKPKESKNEKENRNAFASLVDQRGFAGAVGMILKVAGIAAGRSGRILKGLRLSRLELYAAIGGEDAAQAAVSYGKWCAVLFPAISVILGSMRGKRSRSVRIEPDFIHAENTIRIFGRVYILPILVVWHALGVLFRITADEIRERFEEAKQNAVRSV